MEASFKLHQILLKTTASIRTTKDHRDMVPDSILLLILIATHLSLFKCFVWRIKQWKSFYKLSGFVRHFNFMLSWSRNHDDGLSYYFVRDTAVLHYWIKWQTWLLSTTCLKNILHIFFSQVTALCKHIGQKSEWKPQKNNARNNNQALTQWIVRAKFIQHPSNKAKFIRWVVYTANAALMVG